MTNDTTNIDRIIAKIDNDFNPDNSDWIPRVGAWVHDGLGLLSVSTTKRVKERFVVKDRIANNKCEFKGKIKVFDCNGCEIKEYTGVSNGCCTSPFTGEQINGEVQTIAQNSFQTSGIIENPNAVDVPDKVIDYPGKENDYVSKLFKSGLFPNEKNRMWTVCQTLLKMATLQNALNQILL